MLRNLIIDAKNNYSSINFKRLSFNQFQEIQFPRLKQTGDKI